MLDEPEITQDDTNPNQPITLDERLRREEPPVNGSDTNPSQVLSLEERLRREEPPVVDQDTSPSLIARERLRGDRPPRGGNTQRVTALALLVGAALLTVLALVIWFNADDGTPTPDDEPGIIAQAATSTPTPTGDGQQPAVSEDAAPLEPTAVAMADVPDDAPLAFPTAAVDEIAVALLTPAPANPVSYRAIPRKVEPYTILPAQSRGSVIQYSVQEGDTLESIAARFGLNDFYTLIWSNEPNRFSPLRPGTQLNILPEDGVYFHVTENITIREVAEQYEVDPYIIIDSEYNGDLFGASPETLLVEGMYVVIPGAEGERVNLMAAAASGSSSGSGAPGVISGSYTLWGCTANVSGGSLPTSRPLSAYTWMQGFSLGGHEAVDLAPKSGEVGDPVLAAGAGTVVYAGWSNYGYGNVVVIAHGPVFSIYAHLQRVNVGCGSAVGAGAVIGALGNTGNSSGPHLHFEIRDANWGPQNPQGYVGF